MPGSDCVADSPVLVWWTLWIVALILALPVMGTVVRKAQHIGKAPPDMRARMRKAALMRWWSQLKTGERVVAGLLATVYLAVILGMPGLVAMSPATCSLERGSDTAITYEP